MADTVLILGDSPGPSISDADVGRFDSWNADAIEWFDARLSEAQVGWRCTIVGPHQWVCQARARAITAGAVAEEVTSVVTDAETRRVYCPACGAVTTTRASSVECVDCSVELVVGEHFSAVHSAFLGTRC